MPMTGDIALMRFRVLNKKLIGTCSCGRQHDLTDLLTGAFRSALEDGTIVLPETRDKLLERLRAIRDNWYHDYISRCRVDECLGWEIKVELGQFGAKELKAHENAAEALGYHRAYNDIIKMLGG